MSSLLVAKNKFDGNEYRISALPVHKHIDVPVEFEGEFSKKMARGMGIKSLQFNNIIFEAYVFTKRAQVKPSFTIEFDEKYGGNTTEGEFAKLIQEIIANEKIEDVMNFKNDFDVENVYKKYGLKATKTDIWAIVFLSKMRTIFVSRV